MFSNHRTITGVLHGSIVAVIKSRLVNSGEAVANLCLSGAIGYLRTRCVGVSSPIPHLHRGVATGAPCWNRNAASPIFPVRTCVSIELSTLIRPLYLSNTLARVNSNRGLISAGSGGTYRHGLFAVI